MKVSSSSPSTLCQNMTFSKNNGVSCTRSDDCSNWSRIISSSSFATNWFSMGKWTKSFSANWALQGSSAGFQNCSISFNFFSISNSLQALSTSSKIDFSWLCSWRDSISPRSNLSSIVKDVPVMRISCFQCRLRKQLFWSFPTSVKDNCRFLTITLSTCRTGHELALIPRSSTKHSRFLTESTTFFT